MIKITLSSKELQSFEIHMRCGVIGDLRGSKRVKTIYELIFLNKFVIQHEIQNPKHKSTGDQRVGWAIVRLSLNANFLAPTPQHRETASKI